MNVQTLITDKDKRAGVRLPYDGAIFVIASTDRPQWLRAIEKARKKRSPAAMKADPALATEIMIEATAAAIVLTWENVKWGEDDFPPTLENREKLLRLSPEFRDWVTTEAANIANFGAEVAAADSDAIKSPPPMG